MSKTIRSSTKITDAQIKDINKGLEKSKVILNIIQGYLEKAQDTTIEAMNDVLMSNGKSDEEVTQNKLLLLKSKGMYMNGVAPAIRIVAEFANDVQNKMSKTSIIDSFQTKSAISEHAKLFSNLTVGLVMKDILENADELLELINN